MTTVVPIETTSLGDRSYLATDGQVALVVDPQRDVDRVLAVAEEHAVRITHVLETHVHNDYVSGGLQLARQTKATYVLPTGSGVEFDHASVSGGDVLDIGAMRVTAFGTPGHTHHHVSYGLADGGDDVRAVFTGGSMLYGATGRTDLVGPDHTDALTRAQYRSVRTLARELPADAEVYPTHGFGSFCSATPASGSSSTIGEQRSVNPALTLDEQAYVDTLLAGLDAYPAHYAHMAPMNRRGPAPVDLSPPEPVETAALRHRVAAGEWVVDLRDRTTFAAGHLTGTVSFELGESFVTYVGWLIPWGSPITLIGETADQVSTARRELVRIGVDRLAGAAVGAIADLADGQPLRTYRTSDFAGLAARLREPEHVHVLDTRRHDERRAGHIPGSQHVPIHELSARIEEVPASGEIWVYCASGYRSSVAASLLDRGNRDLVVVNDDYEKAQRMGLEHGPAVIRP